METQTESLRARVEARIEELAKARLKLSDRIFGEGRTPTPGEWRRLEAFDEKLESLWDIENRFLREVEAPPEAPMDPFAGALY